MDEAAKCRRLKADVDSICHTRYVSVSGGMLGTAMAKRKQKRKQSKKLTERINLRVTEDEFALLEMASEQEERSLSNWARRALLSEARRQLGRKS